MSSPRRSSRGQTPRGQTPRGQTPRGLINNLLKDTEKKAVRRSPRRISGISRTPRHLIRELVGTSEPVPAVETAEETPRRLIQQVITEDDTIDTPFAVTTLRQQRRPSLPLHGGFLGDDDDDDEVDGVVGGQRLTAKDKEEFGHLVEEVYSLGDKGYVPKGVAHGLVRAYAVEETKKRGRPRGSEVVGGRAARRPAEDPRTRGLFPVGFARQLFMGFTQGLTLTPAAHRAVSDLSDQFLMRAIQDVTTYAEHAERTVVVPDDVLLLFHRQRATSGGMTIMDLARDLLPADLRNAAIPIARAHNVVEPSIDGAPEKRQRRAE